VARDFDAVAQVAQGFVVTGIDVELLGRHFEFDDVCGFGFCVAKIGFGDVVAFGAPGDVVRVAEGVDLESCDVTREECEVLGGGSEHVPGVEVHEGHEEVEADGCGRRDDEVCEDVVAEFFFGAGVFELDDDDPEGGKGCVGHDDAVHDHGPKEHLFGALWAVAH
jgi:hypothetical protein